MSTLKILVLSGDGVGEEVTGAALSVLHAVAAPENIDIDVETDLAGGACYDQHGVFLRETTARRAAQVDAIIFGAEGGPKWDDLDLDMTPVERSALSRLRKELDLFANVRPVRAWPALIAQTPFRREVIDGADLIILRELTSGIYFGTPRGIFKNGEKTYAVDTQKYTLAEIERVARAAFDLARTRRKLVTSIDKSNVMESGVLWRRTVSKIAQTEYPDVAIEHLLADAFFCALIQHPKKFDVVLADNLFGDLASDAAAPIAGSLGMLPSVSFGATDSHGRRRALYEPVHGSAPDIAGKNIANPCAAILSVALLFEWSLQRPDLARKIETAIEKAVTKSGGTRDIGGAASTRQFLDHVLRALAAE